ncbi:unnamed protein product [Hydatigera taeniaeformis]|uniref:Uncharacterized protein n=1 Tax=Hydatigena taeniaeformis TaxID=6205 RepID=A0A0R3X7K7_HYDTA|nr:unnamed protein product [Hydatigera taeniaeformis]
MAKTKDGNKSQELRSENPDVSILCPSNFLYPSGQGSLGDTLRNDSIELGETGHINYRTGSFLGTFTDHTVDSRKNRKSNVSSSSPKSRSGQTLNDYLISRQLDGAVLPVDENNKQSFAKVDTGKPLNPKVPIELSRTAELDPVLALLQSDVSQLDEFRNNFREQSVRGKKTWKVPPPVVSHRTKKGAANHTLERRRDSKENPAPSLLIKQEDVSSPHLP